MRLFILFVLSAFVAMLMMAGVWALFGTARAPLTGGVGWALLDVALYALLTGAVWWVMSRRLRR